MVQRSDKNVVWPGGGQRRPLAGGRLAVARSFHRVVGDRLRFRQRFFDGLLTGISGREFLADFGRNARKLRDGRELDADIGRSDQRSSCWDQPTGSSPASSERKAPPCTLGFHTAMSVRPEARWPNLRWLQPARCSLCLLPIR